MSTIVIKMQKHAVDELGECIESGLSAFGRAMSIYQDMKHSSEMGERNYMGMRDMDYRYPMMHERKEWEEDDDYMGERRYRDSRGRYASR